MKATGVVRRIDELGRIVVPKEVRRTMRIKEGESLEIFIEDTDKIVLKKYSPVENANDFVNEFVDSIYSSNHKDIVITDNEKIIAVAGNYRKDIIGKRITLRLEDKIQKRNTQIIESSDKLEICENTDMLKPAVIKPINVYGDIIGCVIVSSEKIGDVERSLAEFSGAFMSKYLEG
ncbi:MAG: AbrB/MazE/SpoVT family DNA-binding domain-containing protein [Bacilli bacterium]|nr:AbrB/MazE/SpoVT family DNA-binding domain-containing protein [Bacilli bacterium]